MENPDFIAKLNELTSGEDLMAVNRDVNDLKSKLEDYILEEERKIQVEELTAEEKGEAIDKSEAKDELIQLKEQFIELFDSYKTQYKKLRDEQKAVEEKNLGDKVALIKKLKEIVQNEENIGAAFAGLKDIQEKWKAIGDIPRSKRNEIETEYSHLLDDFFYNINIYKELKEHDFHRNHQLKLDVIEKLKALNKLETIKKVENGLKELQDKWNDIGPVPNEEWEKIKEAYWTEVRSIYNKVNRFYDDRREQMKANLDAKRERLEHIQKLVGEIETYDSVKLWDKATKKVLKLQAEWKEIGFGPKKDNEKIWKQFRKACDTFFEAKSHFFKDVHKEFDAIAEKKKALIDKANDLKQSTDWGNTAKQLKQLQQQWKKLGHAGIKHEQRLWKQFREACDHFFSSREKHFWEQDKQFEVNLKEKEALIAAIDAYKPVDDKEKAIADIREFAKQFAAIGHVPIKEKNRIFKAFEEAMDKQYKGLDMKGDEKEKILFEAKLDTLKASPNADGAMRNLRNDIRKQIDHLNREIVQLENNLGFFANSKGADSLKKEVEKKVDGVKEKIGQLRNQLKMIPK